MGCRARGASVDAQGWVALRGVCSPGHPHRPSERMPSVASVGQWWLERSCKDKEDFPCVSVLRPHCRGTAGLPAPTEKSLFCCRFKEVDERFEAGWIHPYLPRTAGKRGEKRPQVVGAVKSPVRGMWRAGGEKPPPSLPQFRHIWESPAWTEQYV